MENEQIRKAGEYTITQSIKIGGKELVLGEDFSNEEGLFLWLQITKNCLAL